MLSALMFVSVAVHLRAPDSIFQIVPGSQFPFDRKQYIMDSGAHDPVGAFLVNDNGVSDKAYEAIVHNPDCIKPIKLIRKEANGTVAAWQIDGKRLPEANDIDAKDLSDYEVGEVGMVIELPYFGSYPNTERDKPGILCSLGTSKKTTVVGDGETMQGLQKVGKPSGKFANIRFSIRVTQIIGILSKEPGSEKTFEDVTYRVNGPINDTKDKFEHVEIIQKGLPALGSFSLMPSIDWLALEKEKGSVKNKRSQSGAKVIKLAEGTPPEGELHHDLRSNIPYKYWAGINIYRNSTVQGYFGHVAMEPAG